jgi:hypothetical protein
MKITRAAVVLGFIACSPAVAQDLYRCDYANGKTLYQATQCDIGVQQRAIDPANARREQIRESLEQDRLKKRQKEKQAVANGQPA